MERSDHGRPAPGGVHLDDEESPEQRRDLDDLAAATRTSTGDRDATLALARRLGESLPPPGTGRTAHRWASLSTLGAVDLSVARILEPHLDALAILHESGDPDLAPRGSTTTWGVYAAEGPGVRLAAEPDPARDPRMPNAWRLSGTKPWCSLAVSLDSALVTAWVDDSRRGLFAVPLRQPAVTVAGEGWVSHGLPGVRSTSVSFDGAEATAVGGPGWYLDRDGFAWGGIGVAAVWFGGAVGLARRMQQQAAERELDQIGRMHLGVVDAALFAARSVLVSSATAIDAGRAAGEHGALLAARVRHVVADAVETVVRSADHAMGPAPLVFDAEHAARVSDLRVYVRQHHAERDAAALGAAVSTEA